MNLRYAAKSGIGFSFQLVLGRRNLYRLARMLTFRARRDTIDNHGENNGEFDVQDAILSRPGPKVVIDVGANIGEWSGRLLDNFPQSDIQIHAFEPCTGTFAELESRIKDKRLVTVKAACSDSAGTAALNLVGDGCGRNSLAPGLSDQQATELVELIAIDDYCSQKNLNAIDLLKVDAEGHDLAVLRGARRMLQAKAVSVVQFEYNHRWIYSRSYLRDAFELLGDLGYCIGKLSPDGIEFYPSWDWHLEDFCENNYVACQLSMKHLFSELKPEWLVPGA